MTGLSACSVCARALVAGEVSHRCFVDCKAIFCGNCQARVPHAHPAVAGMMLVRIDGLVFEIY
jgi:hypothetical protein